MKEMVKEIWKDITDYEGIYQVSNLGNVRSVDRDIEMSHGGIKFQTGKYLKQTKCSNGYYKVNLYDHERKRKTWRVHTLVALHFVEGGQSEEFSYVNHSNEDILDNRASNLFWTTNLKNNSRGASIGHKIRRIAKESKVS